MSASKQAIALPEDSVDISVRNRRPWSKGFEPNGWLLEKHTDGGWRKVLPFGRLLEDGSLGPMDTYTWRLSVDNESGDIEQEWHASPENITAAFLGPGRYRFRAPEFSEAASVEFTAEGQEPSLTPYQAEETDRVDGRVYVESTHAPASGNTGIAEARVVSDEDSEGGKLIHEQVGHVRVLRNTLSFQVEEEVDSVELRMSERELGRAEQALSLYPDSGYLPESDDTYYVEYRGETYSVSLRES